MSNIEELVVPGALRKTTARIVVGAVALVFLMVLFSTAVLWNSYLQTYASVSQQLQTASTYNEQSLTRTIESIDSALERVRQATQTSQDTDVIGPILRDVLQFSPHLRQILVIDHGGRLVADSAQNFYAPDKAARIDLRALGITKDSMKSLGSRLRVGKGIAQRFIGPASAVGASSSQWLLPIALLSDGPVGHGVHIVAAFNPSALSPSMGSAVYRKNGEAVVALLDGTVILSNVSLKSGLARSHNTHVPTQTSERFLKADAGLFKGELPQMSVPGVVSYRLSSIYPLAILVAATDDDIFDGWVFDNVALILISISIPFVAMGVLITFGTQAIQKLRLHEGVRVLSQVVQQSPASILITDRQGEIVYINSAFSTLYGYTESDVFGQNPRLLKSGKTLNETFKQMWQTIIKANVWHGEIINKTKEGHLKWVDAIIFGLSVEEGPPDFYVGIETDISLKKEYETQLVQEKTRAEAANIAKLTFLSSMSHELRTPLNAIMGFGQVLLLNKKEPLSTSQQVSINTIVNSGQHLLDLVEDILNLAQIDTGNIKLYRQRISLSKILAECEVMITPQAHERGIHVQVSIDDASDLTAWVDEKRLKQILLNLLSNAIKYNRENGTVHMNAMAVDDATVRVSVVDNGDGISSEFQDKLFEPFNRLGQENSSIQGTGIGLNICKDLTEAMGGTIGFESTLGTGSTFWINIPTKETLPK